MAWREAIPLGRTDLSPAEVHALVQQMGAQYKGNRHAAAACCCFTCCSLWSWLHQLLAALRTG